MTDKTFLSITVFDERIAVLSNRHKLSPSALGMGLDPPLSNYAVRNWAKKFREQGKLNRTEDLLRFAEHYHVSVAWLVGEADEEYPGHHAGQGADDPTVEDGMRWRALVELHDDGKNLSRAFEILRETSFDGEQRPISWGDYYSLTKRRIREETAAAPRMVELPVGTFRSPPQPTKRRSKP